MRHRMKLDVKVVAGGVGYDVRPANTMVLGRRLHRSRTGCGPSGILQSWTCQSDTYAGALFRRWW